MKNINVPFDLRLWMAGCALALLAACGGGGRDPILGIDGAGISAAGGTAPIVTPPVVTPPVVTNPVVNLPPSVTAVTPANNTIGVPINTTMLTAAFNEAVGGLSGNTGFTVACAAPCITPTGSVSLDASGKIATLLLTTGTPLSASTIYTATITGAKSVATGLTLASPFVWQFTTGAAPDTTRPRVLLTIPPTSTTGVTSGVAANSIISALFSEDMTPSTINAASFTITCAAPCVSPTGSVSYSVGNRTALFTPTGALATGTTYTATITTAATDLAGNALAGNQALLPAASNYIGTFTTISPVSTTNITVLSTSPAAGSTVCTDAALNVTFNVPSGLRLDPSTISSAPFLMTGPGQSRPVFIPIETGQYRITLESLLLDTATGKIASFKPLIPLTAGATYQVSVGGGASGVKDLAIPANTMATNYTWTFTAVACPTPPSPSPIALGSAASFGAFGGSAGLTNSGLSTIVNGDIGTIATSTAVTGFRDAGLECTYTQTPLNMGMVNGKIYTAPPPPTAACSSQGTAATFAIATQARADALAAYNALVALPAGANPVVANLANLVLVPGVYTASSGAFRIQGGNLTLDAQGNTNAVWIFQMSNTLTVGGPGAASPSSVILTNGAQAKNVFWQVGSTATINAGGGGTMAGTIIAQAGVVSSTAGAAPILTLNGRALSLGAPVTMANTVINVPAP